MWTFPGQGLNSHHSSHPNHCSDNMGSLPCCVTRELLSTLFKGKKSDKKKKKKHAIVIQHLVIFKSHFILRRIPLWGPEVRPPWATEDLKHLPKSSVFQLHASRKHKGVKIVPLFGGYCKIWQLLSKWINLYALTHQSHCQVFSSQYLWALWQSDCKKLESTPVLPIGDELNKLFFSSLS